MKALETGKKKQALQITRLQTQLQISIANEEKITKQVASSEMQRAAINRTIDALKVEKKELDTKVIKYKLDAEKSEKDQVQVQEQHLIRIEKLERAHEEILLTTVKAAVELAVQETVVVSNGTIHEQIETVKQQEQQEREIVVTRMRTLIEELQKENQDALRVQERTNEFTKKQIQTLHKVTLLEKHQEKERVREKKSVCPAFLTILKCVLTQ